MDQNASSPADFAEPPSEHDAPSLDALADDGASGAAEIRKQVAAARLERVPLRRHAAHIIAHMRPELRARSVPRCAAAVVALSLGIDVSARAAPAEVLEKICEVAATAPPSVCFPPSLGTLDALRARREHKAAIAERFSAADLAAAGRVANARERWTAFSLMKALRHILVFDLAAKAARPLTERPGRELVAAAARADCGEADALGSLRASECALVFLDRAAAARTLLACAIEGERPRRRRGAGALAPKTGAAPLNYDAPMLFTSCWSFGIATAAADEPEDMAQRLAEFALVARAGVHASAALGAGGQAPPASGAGAAHAARACAACSRPGTPARRAAVVAAVKHIAPGASGLARAAEAAPHVLLQLAPAAEGDACALAAALFALDLSEADCPVAEYYNCVAAARAGGVSASWPDLSWFEPLGAGTRFAALFAESSGVFDIRRAWSSQFAPLYTPKQVEAFVAAAGFTFSKLGSGGSVLITGDDAPASGAVIADAASSPTAYETPASALQHAETVGGTVVVGHHPRAENARSPISLVELSETAALLGPSGVLSFGTPLGDAGMVAFSVADICDTFATVGSFALTDAAGKTRFLSRRVARQLLELAKACAADAGNPRARAAHAELVRQMQLVEVRSAGVSKHAAALRAAVAHDDAARAAARAALRLLLDAGMYMRGWKVSDATRAGPPHAYPLASAATTYAPESQDAVDVHVTLALAAYDEAVSAIPSAEVRHMVRAAPLLRADRNTANTTRFVPPVNPAEQGFTLEDRLSILREGAHSDTVFACLRMSSNFIVASAYYYLTAALDAPCDFGISELADIS